jgi:hypothetical protein
VHDGPSERVIAHPAFRHEDPLTHPRIVGTLDPERQGLELSTFRQVSP